MEAGGGDERGQGGRGGGGWGMDASDVWRDQTCFFISIMNARMSGFVNDLLYYRIRSIC